MPHDYRLKRNLNGIKINYVGNDLQKSIANVWRKSEVRKNCEFGNIIPSNIYSGSVLRKAKRKILDSKFGIEINNQILSLIELKYTMIYAGSIHHISANPFMIHYWFSYQMIVYKKSLKS